MALPPSASLFATLIISCPIVRASLSSDTSSFCRTTVMLEGIFSSTSPMLSSSFSTVITSTSDCIWNGWLTDLNKGLVASLWLLGVPPQTGGGVERAGDFHILGLGDILGPGLALRPPWSFVIILGLFTAAGAPLKLGGASSASPWKVSEGAAGSSARGSLLGSSHSSACGTGEANDK